MAVVAQTYTVDKSTSGTSLSITKPSGVVSGDLLLMLCSNDSVSDSDQFNAVSGWTKHFEIGSSTSDTHMALYSRVADGTEGSSFTVTMAVSEYALSWCIRLDGTHPTAPIDVIGTESEVSSGSSITCPSITTSEANCMVVAWATEGNGNAHPYTVNSGTGWPGTIPGDATGDTDQEWPSAASQAGCFLTKTVAAAAASNNVVFDVSGSTAYGKAGIQFSIKGNLPAGEMTVAIDGSADLDIVLGGTVEFSTNIAIQTSIPFGGTPVYTELDTYAAFSGGWTRGQTVPAGNNRMVVLAHAHWDNERTDADSSATYDGNTMTPLRSTDTSMTMYYYLLGDGAEETKNIIWTAGADGSQFQSNVVAVITDIEQTTPTVYHASERLASHPSPYEHDLTVTANQDHVILTFECNGASSATFLKASGSDDFTVKRAHGGTLSSSALGYKEYTAGTASQTYIWDTLGPNSPTQNVNQFEIAAGGTTEMVTITLADAGGGPISLIVQDTTHNHTSENTALVQAHTLVVAGTTHNHTAENTVLSTVKLLVVQDSSHTHTVDNVAIVQAHTLAVNGSTHNHTVDNVALVQAHVLASDDTTHNHTAENVNLVQTYTLVVADSTHNHTAENVGLVQAYVLVSNDTTHNHTVDNVALVQSHTLAVNDSSHTHTSENVILVQQHTLVSNDATHPHKAENITLAITLVANDTTHNHTAENTSLEVAVSVNDSSHTHTTENVVLTLSLIPQSTTHNHTAENVALVQTNTLVSQDSTHNHTADNLVLIPSVVILVTQDSTHSHTAEGIGLFSTYITMIGKFNTGATITIKIYNLFDNSLIIDTTMSEIGTTGYFKYKHEDVISIDNEYLAVMDDGAFEQGGRVYLYAGGGVGDVNLLQNIPDIVDAVWDETGTDHNNPGSFGYIIQTTIPSLISQVYNKIVNISFSTTTKNSSGNQENQK